MYIKWNGLLQAYAILSKCTNNLFCFHYSLEAQAQGYAEYLAEQDQGMHHCKLPDCDRHGAGENLATAWGSTTAETNATKGW